MGRLALVLLVTAAVAAAAGTHSLRPAHASSMAWCSEPASRDRPATGPGPAVHVVYARPFDAADSLSAVGPRIDAATRSLERWWRREDPGRAPRFDRWAAACGAQLDVTTVPLVQPTRWYERRGEAGATVLAGVADAGLVRDHVATIVLFDGPGGRAGACAEGDGTASGGVALVHLGACASVPADRMLAHALLHALGGLPAGAAHACPGDSGHVCDDDADVLAPTGADAPAALRLDAGRDDYYGQRAGTPGLRASTFLRRLDEPTSTLAVSVRGAGAVSGPVPGTDCAARCVTRWDVRMRVPLTARPGRGHRFVRWRAPAPARGRAP
jgi:hypothetical protein